MNPTLYRFLVGCALGVLLGVVVVTARSMIAPTSPYDRNLAADDVIDCRGEPSDYIRYTRHGRWFVICTDGVFGAIVPAPDPQPCACDGDSTLEPGEVMTCTC